MALWRSQWTEAEKIVFELKDIKQSQTLVRWSIKHVFPGKNVSVDLNITSNLEERENEEK